MVHRRTLLATTTAQTTKPDAAAVVINGTFRRLLSFGSVKNRRRLSYRSLGRRASLSRSDATIRVGDATFRSGRREKYITGLQCFLGKFFINHNNILAPDVDLVVTPQRRYTGSPRYRPRSVFFFFFFPTADIVSMINGITGNRQAYERTTKKHFEIPNVIY